MWTSDDADGELKAFWRWMKRRAAMEPGIGHLKRQHRMDRNRLKGNQGNRINAILNAAGMNFAKLLKWESALLRLIFRWLFGYQRTLLLMPLALQIGFFNTDNVSNPRF
jgi:IS5 family transposase